MRLPVGVPHRARSATAIAIISLLSIFLPTATQQAGAVDPALVETGIAGGESVSASGRWREG